MKLALSLGIGLAIAANSAAEAQTASWTSPDGMVSLTIPANWDHESAPPQYVNDVGSTLMATWVRKPPSPKDDPLCEVVRNKVDSNLRTLPTSDFVELTLQLLRAEEAKSSGLINHEIISSDKVIGGVPIIDYTTHTKGSATMAAGLPGPNLRIRSFVAGSSTSYAFGIICSIGQTPNAAATIEAFINSVEIRPR